MRKISLIVAFALFTQPVWACQFPAGWQKMDTEQGDDIAVAVKTPVQPVKTGERFNVDVMICGELSETAKIEMDATMPAHKHGMNYIPEVKTTGPEHYQATGMFFHMPGQWQITVDLKDKQTRRFYVDVTAQ